MERTRGSSRGGEELAFQVGSDGIQRVFDRNPRGIAIDASKDAMTRANIELRLEGNKPLDTPFEHKQPKSNCVIQVGSLLDVERSTCFTLVGLLR